MKNMRRVMACMLALLTVFSMMSVALASTKIVNANNVVLRKTPDKAGYKLGNVSKGIKVETKGSKGEYTKVKILTGKYKGKTAYIYSAYISKDGKKDDAATKGKAVVTSAVYLRSTPYKPQAGEANNAIRVLSKRTKVTVISINSRGWAQISCSKGTGWVYSTYLKKAD